MGVRIVWTDRNESEQGHRVYRSLSTIDVNNPPTPIAELGPNIEFYDDGDIVVDQVYYYRVSAFVGGVEKFSDEVTVNTSSTIWTPDLLFQNSEYGGVWNLNDLSTMFKDTAATSPVTNDGDVIQRVNDISGNGLNLVKESSSSGLILRLGSTNYGEGNSDSGSAARMLTANVSALSYPYTMMVVGDMTGTSSGAVGLTMSDTAVTNRCVFALGTRNSDLTGPAVAVYNNSYYDVSVGRSAPTMEKFVNISTFLSGSQFAEDELGNTSPSLNISNPSGMDKLALGGLVRSPSSTNRSSYPGKYSCALLIDRELTLQEKSDLITWAKAQAGIL